MTPSINRRQAIVLAGVAGLAGSTATAAESDRDFWRAWAISVGDKTQLVVEGVYSLGGLGTVAILTESAMPNPPEKTLVLELTFAALPGFWAKVIQPIPVTFVKTPFKKGSYDKVVVRYVRQQTEQIMQIVDAAAGPRKL